MKKWLITPFDYDIYQGLMAPQCPHCKEALITVIKTSRSYLNWGSEEKEYIEETSNQFKYTCLDCGKEINNIGINGVLVFYRNKGEEAK